MEIGDRISVTVRYNDVVYPLRRREAILMEIRGNNGFYKTDDTDEFSSPLNQGVDEVVQRLLRDKGDRGNQGGGNQNDQNQGGGNGRNR